ncbi:hypothetical protein E2C01_102014 [Portunus trituberculatus]|uniref:Uncharacterized protein n=1 Tax=Portunus trituberculatus TaxID=210409 RepID=A0A5B7KHF8_PORTR|nr:hypothetical protein [Portunus trituberculatus]
MLHWPLALLLSLPVRRQRQVLLPLALLGRVVLFIWPIVDVHLPPPSPKPLKGMTKLHRGSAESIEFAQPKQYKVSPGAHDRESSRDRSAMVAPVISVQPPVTHSVPDRASCDEDGLNMETSDDIFTAVPCGPTESRSEVQPDQSSEDR